MKKNQNLLAGILLLVGFAVWTFLIQSVDVQPIGPNGSSVGFAALNGWFHQLTGVHWMLYTLTDWLGLVPICVCLIFAGVGFVQLVHRKSLLKVDLDIILLGVYYVLVIFGYPDKAGTAHRGRTLHGRHRALWLQACPPWPSEQEKSRGLRPCD